MAIMMDGLLVRRSWSISAEPLVRGSVHLGMNGMIDLQHH